MESGQLIKQRKDRIVYNSSIGQTKPANKLVKSTLEVVKQQKLGSTIIKDGKITIFAGCC